MVEFYLVLFFGLPLIVYITARFLISLGEKKGSIVSRILELDKDVLEVF